MGEKELERSNLMKQIVSCVNQCQHFYGTKKELATEDDSRVFSLCNLLETILLHGIKTKFIPNNSSGFSKYTKRTQTLEKSITLFEVISEILSKDEKERYLMLSNIKSDEGRGKAWIRNALNEHTLEHCFYVLINDDPLLIKFYEEWAFMRDIEKAVALPNIASGLSTIIFAIKINETSLDDSSMKMHINYNNISSKGMKKKKKKIEAKIFDNGTYECSKSLVESNMIYFSQNSGDQISLKSDSNYSISSTKSDLIHSFQNYNFNLKLTDKQSKNLDLPSFSTINNHNKLTTRKSDGALVILKSFLKEDENSSISTAANSMSINSTRNYNDHDLMGDGICSIYSISDDNHLNPEGMLKENLINSKADIFDLEIEKMEESKILVNNMKSISKSESNNSQNSSCIQNQDLQTISPFLYQSEMNVNPFAKHTKEKDASSESYGSYDSSFTMNSCLSPSYHSSLNPKGRMSDLFKLETLSFNDLKETLISMMLTKDELADENKTLKNEIDQLKKEIEDSKTKYELLNSKKNSETAYYDNSLKELTKENEVLKLQLRKYLSLVNNGVTYQNKEELPYNHENKRDDSFDAKLMAVASMNAELVELNDSLRLQLAKKNLELQQLRTQQLSEDMNVNTGNLNICVTSVLERNHNSDVFHVYQVYVHIGKDEWSIYRRYTDFHKMHCQLSKNNPIIKSFNFPPKSIFNNKDSKFVEMRRKRLDFYIKQLFQYFIKNNEQLRCAPSKLTLSSISAFFKEDVREK